MKMPVIAACVGNPSERFQTSWNDNHKERDLRRTTFCERNADAGLAGINRVLAPSGRNCQTPIPADAFSRSSWPFPISSGNT
jgi:hypothetical protein